MARILFLGNSSTGLYDFRNGLLLRLLSLGHEVAVSLPDDVRRKEIEAEGVKFYHTDINRRGMNPFQDLKLMREYKRLVGEYRPDAVLAYTIKPNVYGGLVCGSRRIPYISTITGLGSTFQHGGAVKAFVTAMYRMGIRRSGCVFFQNAENRRIFQEEGIVKKGMKVRLVSGSGVDLSRHAPEKYPGHSDDVTRFLYIGRLMQEKGSREYLEAAGKLHDEFGDRVSVAAIGYFDDDDRESADEAVKKGILKFIPYDPDINPYLREADAVVMPSYHEGMSNVLMEASATARPVLASDISGCREIVEDGVTGFLFPPRDAAALTAAMKRFVLTKEDRRREMGLAGRAKMEREFDREKVIDEYVKVIHELLKS